jgi:radical SAM superfamily enzyme YgiQ (UPF0313 family)
MCFGIESGNREILRLNQKNHELSQATEVRNWARDLKIECAFTFILGLPYDTAETMQETVAAALKLDPDFVSFAILVPFPGTRAAEMAVKGEGGLKLLSVDWRDYGKQIGRAHTITGLSRYQLEKIQRRALMKFYFRPRRIFNLPRVASIKSLPFYLFHHLKSGLLSLFSRD